MQKKEQEINLKKYLVNPMISGYALLAVVLFLIYLAVYSVIELELLIIIMFFSFILILPLVLTSFWRMYKLLYIEKKFQNEKPKLKKILAMNIILFIIIIFLFIIFFSNFFY